MESFRRMFKLRQFQTALTLLVACYIIFGLLLPHLCSSWPYSKYFRGQRNDLQTVKTLLDQNEARFSAAEQFLRTHKAQNETMLKPGVGKPVDLVVAIITVNRDSDEIGQLGYLTQTVASVVQTLKRDEWKEMENWRVFICNVDRHETKHLEAMILKQHVTVISKYGNGSSAMLDTMEKFQLFEKEKEDYEFCLRRAAEYNPRYALIMEDDVTLRDNSLVTLRHLLAFRVSPRTEPWLFVKLYYPEKWQGYGNEAAKIAELVGIAILGGTLSTLVFSRTFQWPLLLTFFFGAALHVTSALMIGRPYVQSWRRWSSYTHRIIEAPGCCTQAILYPASVLGDLADYLSTVECTLDFSVDQAIDQFARIQHLKMHLVEPNLANHIGFVSTLRSYSKDAAHFLE